MKSYAYIAYRVRILYMNRSVHIDHIPVEIAETESERGRSAGTREEVDALHTKRYRLNFKWSSFGQMHA